MLTQRLLDGKKSEQKDEEDVERPKTAESQHVEDVTCSGMFCCGRWWYVSPFEFLLPSLCLGILRGPFVIWCGVIWFSSKKVIQMGSLCTSEETNLLNFLFWTFSLYSAAYTTFTVLAVVACLARESVVHVLVYSKMIFLIFDAAWSGLGCVVIWKLTEEPGCFEHGLAASLCGSICVSLGVISTILDLLFIRTVYNPSSTQYNCWSSICWCILCPVCWQHSSEVDFNENANLFNDLAKHVRTMFGGVRGVTLSDIAYSLALVHKLQTRKARKGHIYYCAEGSDEIFASQVTPWKRIQSREFKEDSIEMDEKLEEGKESRSVEELVADWEQPILSNEDWEKFAKLKYFMRYAVAACGWPIYLYLKPCTCFSLFSCGRPYAQEAVGDTCCHSNEAAFVKYTKIDPHDLLFASMVADLERVHYYVCVERNLKQLVVAIRGTMSFQDMATDARQEYVPLTPDSKHLVPMGFLRSANRIIREVRGNVGIKRFLDRNPDYGIVFTGHSLGGGVSIVATVLLHMDQTWERKVQAFAMGPPPTFDSHLARDVRWKEFIFSFVCNDDIVARMSLHNLFRLRSQALSAFRKCSDPARDILAGFRRLDSEAHVTKYRSFDFPHVQKSEIDEKNVPPLETPGKIFHVLGKAVAVSCPCIPCCRWPLQHSSCSPAKEFKSIVYPAAPTTFDEIRVASNMLVDHFPHRYLNTINGIEIPESARSAVAIMQLLGSILE
mmetsp:Transcript_2924/g.4293  ORF Transcript_2924/g.4293 Transcript_2924/m.4293 type:complete len:724 (-) Transcript_2924:120-2291(-)